MRFSIIKSSHIQEENIDLSFLEPMAKRKMSLLDKMVLTSMNQCYNPNYDIGLVFASQYGELDRLKKLISQYTEENEVSPSTFSGSVHNSAVGQFSLIKKIKQSYNSISAEKNTFSAGLFEAIVSTKDSDILFCYGDTEPVKSAFSCLLSTTAEKAGYILKINNNPVPQEFKELEITRFKNFLDGKTKNFTSNDGLISIKKAEE